MDPRRELDEKAARGGPQEERGAPPLGPGERRAGVWDWKSTLSETSRILEGFFASLDFPIAILDKDSRFVRVNESFARACRRPVSDFAGRGHFDFYPHPDNEALFRMVLETREPFQAAAKPFFFPDHSEWATSYWDWSLSPILDRNGDVEFMALSLKDVTAGTKALEQLPVASAGPSHHHM